MDLPTAQSDLDNSSLGRSSRLIQVRNQKLIILVCSGHEHEPCRATPWASGFLTYKQFQSPRTSVAVTFLQRSFPGSCRSCTTVSRRKNFPVTILSLTRLQTIPKVQILRLLCIWSTILQLMMTRDTREGKRGIRACCSPTAFTQMVLWLKQAHNF